MFTEAGYCTQTHFLNLVDKPERVYRGNPSRTLENFIKEDFVSTVITLRSIYIPNYEQQESLGLDYAVSWLKSREGRNKYQIQTKGDSSGLPWYVQNNSNTIFFLDTFSNILDEYYRDNHKKIAFQTGTVDFKTDILNSTHDWYWRLRLYPLELRKEIKLGEISETNTLKQLTEFFWSGGLKNREVATDILTWNLLLPYWKVLTDRAK